MNAERFAEIVNAYGAEPRRWPEFERAEAEAFAARPEAQAMLSEARALDAALDASDAGAPVNLAFMREALAAAPKAPPMSWRPMAAMAACALLGIALGFGGARQASDDAMAAAALEIAFGGGDQG